MSTLRNACEEADGCSPLVDHGFGEMPAAAFFGLLAACALLIVVAVCAHKLKLGGGGPSAAGVVAAGAVVVVAGATTGATSLATGTVVNHRQLHQCGMVYIALHILSTRASLAISPSRSRLVTRRRLHWNVSTPQTVSSSRNPLLYSAFAPVKRNTRKSSSLQIKRQSTLYPPPPHSDLLRCRSSIPTRGLRLESAAPYAASARHTCPCPCPRLSP